LAISLLTAGIVVSFRALIAVSFALALLETSARAVESAF
jgi:hypothetical protein